MLLIFHNGHRGFSLYSLSVSGYIHLDCVLLRSPILLFFTKAVFGSVRAALNKAMLAFVLVGQMHANN